MKFCRYRCANALAGGSGVDVAWTQWENCPGAAAWFGTTRIDRMVSCTEAATREVAPQANAETASVETMMTAERAVREGRLTAWLGFMAVATQVMCRKNGRIFKPLE